MKTLTRDVLWRNIVSQRWRRASSVARPVEVPGTCAGHILHKLSDDVYLLINDARRGFLTSV